MDRFVTEYFLHKFGKKALVQERLNQLLQSLELAEKTPETDANRWIHTFARFCGWIDPLSKEVRARARGF